MTDLWGGRHEGVPQDYVSTQFQVNSLHTDGSLESPDEREHYVAAAKLIARFDPSPRSILDVGCRLGLAFLAYPAEFPGVHVEGCDIVPEFVAVASQRGEATLADAHALPYEDAEFDWLTCISTFEHFYNSSLAAAEMRRVASRGIFVTCDLREPEKRGNSDYAAAASAGAWWLVLKGLGWRTVHAHSTKYSTEFVLMRSQ